MKIIVKEQHIKDGRIQCPFRCPIALALKENGFEEPVVLGNYFKVRGGFSEIVTVKLSKTVERFIYRFDTGKPVKPFSFSI